MEISREDQLIIHGNVEKVYVAGGNINIHNVLGQHMPVPPSEIITAQYLVPHASIVGRKKEKDLITEFIDSKSSGVIFVTGPPGIGKTALLSNLAVSFGSTSLKDRTIIYFFNRDSANYSVLSCLTSLCNDLAYTIGEALERSHDADSVGTQLGLLLSKVSSAAISQGKLVFLIIDAMDECENPSLFLRLLPKALPEGVFMLISSRQIQSMEGISSLPWTLLRIDIEPRSEQNLHDAHIYFQSLFPSWSNTLISEIVEKAEGNFLFLRLFGDVCVRDSVREENVLDCLTQFGVNSDDQLRAFYQRYWFSLKTKCRELGRFEDFKSICDLVGLLAVAFSPLTITMICRYLGNNWTSSKFEEMLEYLQPLIQFSGNTFQPSSQFRLFHGTFKAFVRDRLSADLNTLHNRIVRFYMYTDGTTLNISKLDDYGLNNIVRHAAICDDDALLKKVLSPEYIKQKSTVLGSITPVLSDLGLAIEAFASRGDIGRVVKFSLVRESLIKPNKNSISGLQALIEARFGDEFKAKDTAILTDDADNELLILATLAYRYRDLDKPLARQYVEKMLEIASQGTNTLSLLGGYKANPQVTPKGVETAAHLILDAFPDAAISLALTINEPRNLGSWSWEEAPTTNRVLWFIISKCVASGARQIEDIPYKPQEVFYQVSILLALATYLLKLEPQRALTSLKDALELLTGTDDPLAFKVAFIRYFLWHLPSIKPTDASMLLTELLQLQPYNLMSRDITTSLDVSIRLNPDEWQDAATGLPNGDAKDLIQWRLFELNCISDLAMNTIADASLSDQVIARRISERVLIDTEYAVRLAQELTTFSAYYRTIVEVVRRITVYDKKAAMEIIEAFLKLSVSESDSEYFNAIFHFLKVTLQFPCKTRQRLLVGCERLAQKIRPQFASDDANAALNGCLAQAVAVSNDPGCFFCELISEMSGARDREMTAVRVITSLPLSVCQSIADDLTLFGLNLEPFDEMQSSNQPLFLPETKVNLLAQLLGRLSQEDRARCEYIAEVAASMCASLEDSHDRNHAAGNLLTALFKVSPALLWTTFQRCRCSYHEWKWVLELEFGKMTVSRSYQMERYVRLNAEEVMGLQFWSERPMYWKKRAYALQTESFPAISDEIAISEVDEEWLDDWPDVLVQWLKMLSEDRYSYLGISDLGSTLQRIAELSWSSFMGLVNHPGLRPFVNRILNVKDLSYTLAKSHLPGTNLTADIHQLDDIFSHGDTDEIAVGEKIKVDLAAISATISPELCLDILDTLPIKKRQSFEYKARGLEPRAVWRIDQTTKLVDLLSAEGSNNPRRYIVQTLAWLNSTLEERDHLFREIYADTLKENDPWTMYEVGKTLAEIDKQESNTLLITALNLAIQDENERLIRNILETNLLHYSKLSSPVLFAAAEIDATTTERWGMHSIIRIMAQIDVDAAVEFLPLLKSDDKHIEEVLDALSAAIADTASPSPPQLDLLLSSDALDNKVKVKAVLSVLKTRAELGKTTAIKYLDYLTDVDDWVKGYLLISPPVTADEFDRFIELLHTRVKASESANSRERALWKSAEYCIDKNAYLASSLLSEAAQANSKVTFATVMIIGLNSIVRVAMSLPPELAAQVGESALDSVRGYPFGKQIHDAADALETSLIYVSTFFWRHNRERATELLTEVGNRYRKLEPLHSVSGFSVSYLVKDISKELGMADSIDWIQCLFSNFSENTRILFADEVCNYICNVSGEIPLEHLNVWTSSLPMDGCELLQVILPYCSNTCSVSIHKTLAISALGFGDVTKARAEIIKSIQLIEAGRVSLGESAEKDIWLIYASLHGMDGILYALPKLASMTAPEDNISSLISLAVKTSNKPDALLHSVWNSVRETEAYGLK